MNAEEQAQDELDLTGEAQGPPDVGPAWQIIRERERWRGWLALAIVGILAATVVGAFVTLWADKAPIEDVERLLSIIIGPVATLAAAVTAFYYGGRSNRF